MPSYFATVGYIYAFLILLADAPELSPEVPPCFAAEIVPGAPVSISGAIGATKAGARERNSKKLRIIHPDHMMRRVPVI